MRDTQENRAIPQTGSSHHLKWHLQLKTKDARVEGGHPVMGGYQEKLSKQGKVVRDLSHCLLQLYEF